MTASSKSQYESRLERLSAQIAELEAENVGEKKWTVRGETHSRARPVNSLLEEDLEYEHIAKVVPVVTEETTASLEDKIKQRILDVRFARPYSHGFTV
jgi:U3 small nucleolar RNA-associated protein MPP10